MKNNYMSLNSAMIHSKNCGMLILEIRILMMSEIVHVYRGEYVSIDLVDDTTELTVENNIYSLTESMELQQDLARGLHKLVTGLLLLKEARSE